MYFTNTATNERPPDPSQAPVSDPRSWLTCNIPDATGPQSADAFKLKGNQFYSKGNLRDAVRYYTAAIRLDESNATYWSNRALVFLKLKEWEQVASDGASAIRWDDKSIKGHYFLGKALGELGQHAVASEHLTRALSLSNGGGITADIERSIMRLIRLKWEVGEETRSGAFEDLQRYVTALLDVDVAQNKGDSASEQRRKELADLFNDIRQREADRKLPDHLTCKIGMGLMSDPVITSAGHSYERELVLSHIARNGSFDPVTMEPIRPDALVPNRALKEATELFVRQHPWAQVEFE